MQTAVALLRYPDLQSLGTMLPRQGWFDLGWSGLGFAIAVLLLRPLPSRLLLRPLLTLLRGWRETAFSGWFATLLTRFFGRNNDACSGHAAKRRPRPNVRGTSAPEALPSVMPAGSTPRIGAQAGARRATAADEPGRAAAHATARDVQPGAVLS